MSKYQTQSLFDTEEQDSQSCDGYVIRVAFEAGIDSEFDYLVPKKLQPIGVGQRVEVPFGRKNKLEIGFCVGSDIPLEESFAARNKSRRLKKVVRLIDKQPLLDAELMELARWISGYYICPLGQVLAAMVPGAVKKGIGVKKIKYIYLADDYEPAITKLRGGKQKQIVTLLAEQKAFNSETALELNELLDSVGSTKAPVKKLAEKLIIKIAQRTIIKSLPAIPESMMLKSAKIVLNSDQQKALTHINSQIESSRFAVTLLHGVTDSGKTEIYIRAIEACLQKGKSAIVLLPEIALTTQTVQRFQDRFNRIAVMHSGLTAAQRNMQWQKIRAGDADVVIGARSAVFAPVQRLGLIVVDEEHEPSYKQDAAPRYNGRDVAIKRAQISKSLCILGTATPSLETLLNCRDKKHFSLVHLPKRVMDLPMPEMKLVDLKQEVSGKNGIDLISQPLAKKLSEILAKKEQAILLLNRRGYSNFIFCASCKHTLQCRNCDVTLTFHKSKKPVGNRMKTVTPSHMDFGYAICHYCGAQRLVPKKCPLCGKSMALIGLGSQKLEEQLKRKFPQARITRIDSDSMAGKDYYKLLNDFGNGKIDILAGTQMLAKGLHFPNVTVVGIISADTSLYLPDFRANERTFQLISQVAGRTGRSAKKGTVFVQTFLPDQPAIQFALNNDFKGFVTEELKHRKTCNLPPYWRLAVIVLRDENFDKLETASKKMREIIDYLIDRDSLEINIRGPMPAPISRLKHFHRIQIIVQAPKAEPILRLFKALQTAKAIKPAVKIALDIDPINLL